MSDSQDDTTELFPDAAASSATEPYEFGDQNGTTAASEQTDVVEPYLPHDGPRIRWAGIVWGLAFALVGFIALRLLLTPAGRDAVYEWTVTLTPLSVIACVLLVLGALLLLTGLVGLAHRLQRLRQQPR